MKGALMGSSAAAPKRDTTLLHFGRSKLRAHAVTLQQLRDTPVMNLLVVGFLSLGLGVRV